VSSGAVATGTNWNVTGEVGIGCYTGMDLLFFFVFVPQYVMVVGLHFLMTQFLVEL
jgi:hypothetical protein